MGGSSATLTIEGEAPLEVASLRLTEQINAPLQGRAKALLSPHLAADAARLIGRHFTLELLVGENSRHFIGAIWAVRIGPTVADGRSLARLELRSKFSRLGLGRRNRVFQTETSVSIAHAILEEHELRLAVDLRKPLLQRELAVQRDESDEAFVQRLMAEEGLSYVIGPGERHEERLRAADGPQLYLPIEGSPVLTYRPELSGSSALGHEEHDVTAFAPEVRSVTQGPLLTAFDYQRPGLALTRGKPGPYVTHEEHGPFGETQVDPQDEVIVGEQLRRDHERFAGRSECARVAAGAWATIEDHPTASGEHAFTRVEHRLTPATGAAPAYSNRFSTVRRAGLLRPPRPVRRVVQSLETATVVGPANEEVHCDGLGRVKVRFHWDAEAASERSSCWIRVAQAWAGSGFGAQFVPRVGMEVLVGFLGGDPDRPVIMGCLPNTTHQPPFSAGADGARSGIRTAPIPLTTEGPRSELSFLDARGAEEVKLVSRRDLNVEVQRNQREQVAGSSLLQVVDDRIEEVGGDHKLKVAGRATTVLDGDVEESIGGDFDVAVAGRRSAHVRMDDALHVAGDLHTNVLGARSDGARGSWTLSAESVLALQVGNHVTPGSAEITVVGQLRQSATQSMVFTVEDRLQLQCGQSSITLLPDRIVLNSPTLELVGKAITAKADGPSLKLDKSAEITSDELILRGKTAKLRLEQDAELRGSQIKLANAEPRTPSKDTPKPDKTVRLSIRFRDDAGKPYAARHFELTTSDGARVEGITGEDGLLQADVPEDARYAKVELWLADYPKGPRRQYSVTIDDQPDANTLPGARIRLQHLGFAVGPIDDEQLDPTTERALRAFQSEQHIEATGALDDATAALLTQAHGS